ncbi:MAG: zinc ribbon domain-containing protein [Rhizobiales bacterium]|uniref:zinc-ribbon domain-containing protein n=1 Tax=uncultured Sphingorhabdus sp. TaxID=1686106 RepID=UPI001AC552A3|nr:zinc ribbon domain-containing protein [Hyphomicrobiales bacterium]
MEVVMGSHFLDRLFGRRYGGGHGGGHHGGGHGDQYGSAPDRGTLSGNRHSPDWNRSAPPAQQRILVCPSCRFDNTPDSRFCVNCGQRFGLSEAVCSKCSTSIPANAKFCSACGTAVAGANPQGT